MIGENILRESVRRRLIIWKQRNWKEGAIRSAVSTAHLVSSVLSGGAADTDIDCANRHSTTALMMLARVVVVEVYFWCHGIPGT